MLQLYIRIDSFIAPLWGRVLARAGRALSRRRLNAEEGQTTAEYALVILAAAAVAVVLIAWARSSGKLPAFFDKIIDDITGNAQ